jgi:hypothetical protein
MNALHLILLVGAFALIAVYEIPGMVKERHWRDLSAFSALLLFTLVLSILLYARVDVPNPVKWIEAVVHSLTKITGDFLR